MVARVEQEIVIDAPVDVVWRTVTDPEQVVRWFADEVDLQATSGYDGSLTLAGRSGAGSRTVRVSVQSVEPRRSLSYRWQHPPGVAARAGNSLLVTFTLIPEGAGTRLRVVETGVEDMGWTPEAQGTYVTEHNHGWATHLGRLRDHLAARPTDSRA